METPILAFRSRLRLLSNESSFLPKIVKGDNFTPRYHVSSERKRICLFVACSVEDASVCVCVCVCVHSSHAAKNEKGLRSHVSQKHKWQFYPDDATSDDSADSTTESDYGPSRSSTRKTSKWVCPECKQDCYSGGGLSSHQRQTGHGAETAPSHVKKNGR